MLVISEYYPNNFSITPYGFTNAAIGQYNTNTAIQPNMGYNSNLNLTPPHTGYFVIGPPALAATRVAAPTINYVHIADYSLVPVVHFNVLLPSTHYLIQGSTFTRGSTTLTIVSNAPAYYVAGYVPRSIGSGTSVSYGVYTRNPWP